MTTPSIPTQSRVLIGIAGLLALVIVAVVLLFSMLIWPVGCGGDGDSPYAAMASPRGDFCEITTNSGKAPLYMLFFLSPLLVTPLAGIIAVIKRRYLPLLIGILIAMLAMGAMLAPMMVLENHCTAEQRASLPSRQCETYN